VDLRALLALGPIVAATPVYNVCYPGYEVSAYNWFYDEYGNFSTNRRRTDNRYLGNPCER
jgi:NAD(P)H-dependent FMN reductase